MAKNKVAELCWWFKMEYDKARPGSSYVPGGQDYREAKQFLDFGEPDYEQLAKCIPGYFRDDYWETRGFPCYGFLRDPNQYAPKPERVIRQAMISCSACGSVHGVNDKCKVVA